jgi:hypothetical protein
MTGPRAPSSPTATAHLSEEERHGLADETLADDRRVAALAHMAECAACANDVARLAAFQARVDQLPPMPTTSNDTDATLDALWPAIRSRIERGKVVPLGASPTAPPVAPGRRSVVRGRGGWLAAVAVAAVLLVVVLPIVHERRGRAPVATRPAVQPTAPNASPPLIMVADSAPAYRQQVEMLLEDLELRRAMLRPSTAATIDRDLRLIDDAIAELNAALARDPNNPALRQLLAASYRQKRDLLKRIDDAS